MPQSRSPRRSAGSRRSQPSESELHESQLLSPSQNGAPQEEAEASSESSSQGYAETSTDDFIAEPGPEFDPEHAPEPPVSELEQVAAQLEEWDEHRVRELLTLQGEITHGLLAVGPEDEETWLHTEKDLRAIAPPLTRIMNRYDAIRAAAAAGDEALLAAAVARYGVRNYVKRRRYMALHEQAAPQPVTGAEAPPDTGPESDAEWLRTQPMTEPPAITPKGTRRR